MNPDPVAACRELVEANRLETIIVAGIDVNGVPRGKRLSAGHFLRDPAAAVPLSDLVLVLDVRGEVVTPPKGFQGWWPSGPSTGHADVLLMPDLATLRAVSWADATGIVLGDFHHVDGTPVAASPRSVLRRVLDRAAARGFSPRMAAELEFF